VPRRGERDGDRRHEAVGPQHQQGGPERAGECRHLGVGIGVSVASRPGDDHQRRETVDRERQADVPARREDDQVGHRRPEEGQQSHEEDDGVERPASVGRRIGIAVGRGLGSGGGLVVRHRIVSSARSAWR